MINALINFCCAGEKGSECWSILSIWFSGQNNKDLGCRHWTEFVHSGMSAVFITDSLLNFDTNIVSVSDFLLAVKYLQAYSAW